MMKRIETMEEINEYLSQLPTGLRSPEERLLYVKNILSSLNEPQLATPAIHIAGTSGKGSTAYFAASLLTASGYKTGLIVSPHVHTVKERAQINGTPLTDDIYLKYFNDFIVAIKNVTLTYVEFLALFAFWVFSEEKVDYMVVEVGMGGRLDPTNVLNRDDTIRIITDIGLDHTEFLGDTLPKIASEKAGIIHERNQVFVHPQSKEIIDVFKSKAIEENSHLSIIPDSAPHELAHLPPFQKRNWTLAYAAVQKRLEMDNKHPISNRAKSHALQINIPGRFEVRKYNDTTIVLDAAHNPQKITALVHSLKKMYPSDDFVIVASFGTNKISTLHESLRLLSSIANTIVLTQFTLDFSDHASIETPVLARHVSDDINIIETKHPTDALEQAVANAKQKSSVIVITGSFYLLDNIYPMLDQDFGKNE